jgi:hypothetical protein
MNLNLRANGGLYTVLRGRDHILFVKGTPDQGVREMDLVLVTESWRSILTFSPLIFTDQN